MNFNIKIGTDIVVKTKEYYPIQAKLDVGKVVHVSDSIENVVESATEKTTLVGDDFIPILDSEDNLILKKVKASRLADGGLF